MNNSRSAIAEKIVSRRAILGITQRQLSELSKVGMKTIYLLEQGTANPSLQTLEQVLDVLGLTLEVNLKAKG